MYFCKRCGIAPFTSLIEHIEEDHKQVYEEFVIKFSAPELLNAHIHQKPPSRKIFNQHFKDKITEYYDRIEDSDVMSLLCNDCGVIVIDDNFKEHEKHRLTLNARI